jgi:tRNA-specific 2-thiouridylase
MSNKVVVAMSGGVDSTVAAQLMVDAGYDVVGVTMLLWGGARQGASCSTGDSTLAAQAAATIGVDHVVIDWRERFDNEVVVPFGRAASAGRTMNPCVSCNKKFKLDGLFTWAHDNGYTDVATGHHAQIVERDGRRQLARSVDRAKDQSYVLSEIAAWQLDMLCLPLGQYTKDDVRTFAAGHNFPQAAMRDSMDLCFNRSEHVDATEVSVMFNGQKVGTHQAVELLTVGQRRGLGVNVGEPVVVTSIDAANKTVTVGPVEDLYVDTLTLEAVNILDNVDNVNVYIQQSAHGTPAPGHVRYGNNGNLIVTFNEPTKRAAPGQHVVLYRDNIVVAAGVAR